MTKMRMMILAKAAIQAVKIAVAVATKKMTSEKILNQKNIYPCKFGAQRNDLLFPQPIRTTADFFYSKTVPATNLTQRIENIFIFAATLHNIPIINNPFRVYPTATFIPFVTSRVTISLVTAGIFIIEAVFVFVRHVEGGGGGGDQF